MKYFFSEAELILAIRKVYGYSQKDFCVFLGYSQPSLSKIENGQISPDMKFVIALAQKLNLDLNVFKYGHIPKLPDYLHHNRSSRLLRNPYLVNGVFPARMTFLLLEHLSRAYTVDVFEKLEIPREIFPFFELRFNLDLFRDLLKHFTEEEVIGVIKSIRVSAPALMADVPFKEALLKVALFDLESVISLDDAIELGFGCSDQITPKESVYFQYLLSFYLLTELNLNVSPVLAGRKRHDIVLRLHAG